MTQPFPSDVITFPDFTCDGCGDMAECAPVAFSARTSDDAETEVSAFYDEDGHCYSACMRCIEALAMVGGVFVLSTKGVKELKVRLLNASPPVADLERLVMHRIEQCAHACVQLKDSRSLNWLKRSKAIGRHVRALDTAWSTGNREQVLKLLAASPLPKHVEH